MPQSKALLVRGHQGVGKSTLAGHIAEGHGFCRLSKDDLYVPVMNRDGDHRAASDIAYLALNAVLGANSRSGINFVVDAPFNGPLAAPALMEDLTGKGFITKSVLVICSDLEEWEARLQRRGDPSTPNHLVTSLDEIRGFRGSLDSHPFENELVVDTATASVGELAMRCVEYLQQD